MDDTVMNVLNVGKNYFEQMITAYYQYQTGGYFQAPTHEKFTFFKQDNRILAFLSRARIFP